MLQVLTMKQTAEVMVHSYPKMPVLEDMLNTFAAERGFPDADLLATAAEPLHAEWASFQEYIKLVDPDFHVVIGYAPLCTAAPDPCRGHVTQPSMLGSRPSCYVKRPLS